MCWITYGFLRCANSTLYFDLHFAYSPNFFGTDVLFGRWVRLLFRKRWLSGHLSTHPVLYRTPFLSSCLWSHFATSLTFHAVSVIVSGVAGACSALCCCSLPDIGFPCMHMRRWGIIRTKQCHQIYIIASLQIIMMLVLIWKLSLRHLQNCLCSHSYPGSFVDVYGALFLSLFFIVLAFVLHSKLDLVDYIWTGETTINHQICSRCGLQFCDFKMKRCINECFCHLDATLYGVDQMQELWD